MILTFVGHANAFNFVSLLYNFQFTYFISFMRFSLGIRVCLDKNIKNINVMFELLMPHKTIIIPLLE